MNWLRGIILVLAVSAAFACRHTADDTTGHTTLSVLMAPDPTGIWHRLFAEFEAENPSIRLNVIEGPTSTNARADMYVASFLSGESAYDLVYADVVWVAKFAAAGWLEDLTDRWPRAEWERFMPVALEGSSYRGRIYRVPIQMDGGVLFYRADLLKQAEEEPPQTLGDMVRIARKLQRPGERWGFVWQGKQYEGLVCNFLEVLTAHGGYWIDTDTRKVGLGEPRAAAALAFLRDCIERWKISPPGVTTYTEEESRQMFQAGRAVFLRNWPYVLSLSRHEGPQVKDRIGMIPLPKTASGKPAAALGGWGFGIARNGRHRDEAWIFCRFISAPERVRRLHEAVGMQPALKAFYEDNPDPAQQAMYNVLQHAVTRPMLPEYEQASDILQRYVSAAISGRLSVEQALKRAEKETEFLLQKGQGHEATR